MCDDLCARVIDLLNMTNEDHWRAIANRNPALKFAWIRQVAKENITEPGYSKLALLYCELTDEPFVIQRKAV
jgi:hypothetical protein